MIDMLNVVKEKLELSPDLRKKINWASKYTSTSITPEKGTLVAELIQFDNEYNDLFLPLFADKEMYVYKSDIEKEIIRLTKQKDRIKKRIYV